VFDAALDDPIPQGLTLAPEADARCIVEGAVLRCLIGALEPGDRVRFTATATTARDVAHVEALLEGTEPRVAFRVADALISLDFTWGNFAHVFDAAEFWDVLWTTIVYTVFSTAGALILGVFAALLLQDVFRGRALLRGLFLFPYVAPVIAVAYIWATRLDPNSGALNAILLQLGWAEGPVNFLGQRDAFAVDVVGLEIAFPMALATVIVFEAWR
jgi:multiple sugar transport system permease protein